MPLNRRLLAREWLWALGVFVGTVALNAIAIARGGSGNGFADFWAAAAFFYALVSGVRLTVWAIRTIRSTGD